MRAFEYSVPRDRAEAAQLLAQAGPGGRPMGGGTDLTGLLKNFVATPERIVDLKGIPDAGYIKDDGGGLRIGATTTLSELEASPLVQQRFPILIQAVSQIASPQIRNVGTVGGNLNQRPRCWYYRNVQTPCLRRDGTYCSAVIGENKYHAILGGAGCFIVHPSDLAPALIALDAQAEIVTPTGSRVVPLEDYFVLPRQDVHNETILKPGEFLNEVRVPAPREGSKGLYLKHRTRGVWDFAILSVALQAQIGAGNVVTDARLVLGAVAPAPWRSKAAEAALRGKPLTQETAAAAARAAVEGARPLTHNAYKIDLAQAMVKRACAELA